MEASHSIQEFSEAKPEIKKKKKTTPFYLTIDMHSSKMQIYSNGEVYTQMLLIPPCLYGIHKYTGNP